MNLQKYYPELDIQKIYTNFIDDLKKSASGQETSLKFIKNSLPVKKDIRDGTKIQVLVIGGTICRSAIVEKSQGQPKILDTKYITKPLFPTKEVFLEFVVSIIDTDIDIIAINSGDTITPILDGNIIDAILVEPDKENKLEGLKGEKVGKSIMDFYLEKYQRQITVHIVNDTICLLLCGLAEYTSSQIAAGIVGTGVNTSVFLDETTAVNLESGCFNNFPLSEAGLYVNEHAEGKDEFLFQKEVSGAYLFTHFNYLIEKWGITYPSLSKSVELTEIAKQKLPEVSEVAEAVLTHSAMLFACQVAGITNFLQKDMVFVIEGSLFWLGYNYKNTVEEIVKALVPNFQVTFRQIPNSDIIGGAKIIF